MSQAAWKRLNQQIVACKRCPRLREHCRQVATLKRNAYRHDNYWGQPVPNFGPPAAGLLIVGLAPGAHGANRTGRMFTGDRSGEWLYRALHRAGFASQPNADHRRDGLRLIDCAITAVCHCAPPDNKPTAKEVDHCANWFQQTVRLANPAVVVALGQLAWKATLREARRSDHLAGTMPKFAHATETTLTNGVPVIASYHPSQQNTFTKRLTEPMLDAVFSRARDFVDGGG